MPDTSPGFAATRHEDAYLGDDGAARVAREELRARVAAGDAVVPDVRPVEEYRAGHIHLPVAAGDPA